MGKPIEPSFFPSYFALNFAECQINLIAFERLQLRIKADRDYSWGSTKADYSTHTHKAYTRLKRRTAAQIFIILMGNSCWWVFLNERMNVSRLKIPHCLFRKLWGMNMGTQGLHSTMSTISSRLIFLRHKFIITVLTRVDEEKELVYNHEKHTSYWLIFPRQFSHFQHASFSSPTKTSSAKKVAKASFAV